MLKSELRRGRPPRALDTPTMQEVQEAWMGSDTQHAIGVSVLVTRSPGKFGKTILNTKRYCSLYSRPSQ
jgi:hypothetical protein